MKGDATKAGLIDETSQRARLTVAYTGAQWAFRTQADATRSASQQTSNGYMLTQSATWSGLRGLQATVQGGYFHTDDYASRIYAYERGLLYAFSFPAYFGEGLHYALFLRADMGQRWMLIAKLSVTDYFDRDHISSGLQQIDRSSKADLELQLRLKL